MNDTEAKAGASGSTPTDKKSAAMSSDSEKRAASASMLNSFTVEPRDLGKLLDHETVAITDDYVRLSRH